MMSFGQLSRWYSNLAAPALRNPIAQPRGILETVLVPLDRHIVDVRNICAHHGRLWSRGFRTPPKLPQKPGSLLQTLDQKATQAAAWLYNGLCKIAHVVGTVAPNSSWAAELAALLKTHSNNDLASIGFPGDWSHRPLWR